MSLIKTISDNLIQRTATRLIKKSKKTLLLTMILYDEMNSVSEKYINLLNKKAKQGIEIKRIAFGNMKDFKTVFKRYEKLNKYKNFSFKKSSNMNDMQRMLISDESEMIFAVYVEKNKKQVFYTNNQFIIKGFVNYFKCKLKTCQ